MGVEGGSITVGNCRLLGNCMTSFLPIPPDQWGPIHLVVVQPTTFCNLDCDYCYLPDRHLKNRLSLDLIAPIFTAVLTSPLIGDEFTICWHAGEPLAVPISFYRSAFQQILEVSDRHNPRQAKFVHSIQTNGTLITPAWCDLFREYGVQVGVSIDGPAFIHDAHRKTRNHRGSHAATLRGIETLRQNDISLTAIAVITEESLDYPDEIFHFFRECGINDVGFNIEEIEGVNRSSSLEKIGVLERYRQFIERFWDLTTSTRGEFKVREFECLCGLIYENARLEKTEMNYPFAILNIDYRGNFSTFDPELLAVRTERYGDFVLGNLLSDPLDLTIATEKLRKIYRDIAGGVELCRNTCDYFGVCGGGAGSNKYWENGTFLSSETNTCRYRIKVITDVILEKLESALGIESSQIE